MSDEALKPCPFCGGEAKYYYYTPRDHNIECESCRNGTCLHETKAEAITAWNTRADDDRIEALQADNARLREEIARLRGPVTTYKKGYGVGDGDAALQETER